MIGMNRSTGKPLAGAAHLEQSIGDILGTPRGTRVGRRDYGSDLPELLDQPMNDLGRIRVFAATALALMRQEGRARLSRVSLGRGVDAGAYVLRIQGTRTDTVTPAAPLDLSIPVRAASALA